MAVIPEQSAAAAYTRPMTRVGNRSASQGRGEDAVLLGDPAGLAVSPAADPEGPASPPGRHRRSRGWRPIDLIPLWRPLSVLVAARLVMWFATYVYTHVTHQYSLTLWDGGWYVLAAQHGWPHHVSAQLDGAGQNTLAFFPAFPTVIRAVHFLVPLTWLRAGQVAAFICEMAMVSGVWLLARDVWGRTVADRSVVLLCFFPGAFILVLMYSEPLTIATAAFCLLALRRQQWVVAGIMAALCATTRIIGVAVIAACVWEAAVAIRRDRRWRSTVAVVMAPAGILAWFAYLWASTGDRLAWLHTEENGWAQHSSVMAIPDLVKSALHTHPADMNQVLALASTALGVVLLVVLVAARGPATFVVYSAAVLVLSATSVNPAGIRFRFVMTAFPLVIIMAKLLKDAAFSAAVALCSVLTGVLLVVTVTNASLIP